MRVMVIYIYTRWEYERCTPGLPEMSSSLSLCLSGWVVIWAIFLGSMMLASA